MLLVIVIQLALKAAAEVYSSYENVKNMNSIENHLTKMLGEYIATERERIQILEKFQHAVIGGKNYTDPDSYISYPTNQFNVIHRFVADWIHLESWTQSKNEEISLAINAYKHLFPDQSDIKGAINAIHRLQDIYRISAGHLTHGEQLGGAGSTVKGQPFKVKALFLFIKSAYESGEWEKCADWGQQAYLQLHTDKEFDPGTQMWFDVGDYFSFCLFKIGDVVHAIEVISEVILHYPEEERLSSNLLYYNRQVKKLKINSLDKRSVISEPLVDLLEASNVFDEESQDIEITFVPKLYPGSDETVLSEEVIENDIQDMHYKNWTQRMRKYRKLCREPAPLTNKMKEQVERLTCYYKQDTPRSLLQPIRVEVVWPSPRILLFHDLITDNEAQVIMSLAQPGLNRATVHNKITGKLENAEYRVSKTAWLDDDMQADTERMVRRVNRRMEDATELSHENAELQQVNNYGMAGQYESHYDMRTSSDYKKATEFLSNAGNRVATLLLYLTVPLSGGATPFTDAGVRLTPTKNSAVFWYNLLPNGEPDLLTRHAGCPVLAGTKWVMNKWFHEHDQMFTRPCHTKRTKRELSAKLYDGRYTV